MVGRRRKTSVAVLLLAGALLLAPASPPARAGAGPGPAGDPMSHLERFIEVAQPPEYRRFGSPGMAAAAGQAAAALVAAGFDVVRLEVPLTRWAPDYSPARAPMLERTADGASFSVDTVFSTTVVTPPEGITCTVRALADVGAGDCGFVPFDQASPEWNNITERAGDAFDEIIAAGGIGAVVQGDPERDARFALRLRRALPGVVAVVDASEVVGQQVTLRSIGADEPAIAHEVIGIWRPADPAARYLLLQGHLDGWYAAAADNGAGSAAVLAAAERLAADGYEGGLIVALHDGEEWGLLGSKAMAEQLASPAGIDPGDCGSPVHLADIAGVVNLDAPSARASDVQAPLSSALGADLPLFQWRVLVHSEEPVLGSAFLAAMVSHGVLGLPITTSAANELNGGIGRTDGKWFHEAGIPVVWPVAGYPEYHTEADTLEVIDPADLEALTAATVDLVESVDPAAIGPVLGATPLPREQPAPPASCLAAGAEGTGAGEVRAEAAVDPAVSTSLPTTGASGSWWPSAAGVGMALTLLARRWMRTRSPLST